MRLAAVEIRDFRSIFLDGMGRPFRVELGPGMNTFVGPNNCGKSNVLRAVSLALDPQHAFDGADDIPGDRPFAHPIVTLRFAAGEDRDEERALLDAAERYERAVGATATHASRGEVHLQVAFPPLADGTHGRREVILTPDDRTPGDEHAELLADAVARLRDAVRFVLISSGESLQSVLEGNFREILHSVIRERLEGDFHRAEQSRTDYIEGLQNNLLAPLRDRLFTDIADLFPEIKQVDLSPRVSSIESTLSNVGVSLRDVVATPLAGKGTGIRGAVLVAMLRYLAGSATRGMVFAVEEPEAFLHPAAQEDLRDHLEDLSGSDDVSLLVTTHSPFIASRSEAGRVFALHKDAEGRTRISGTAAGHESHAPLMGELFRQSTYAELLRDTNGLPEGAKALVLVEGEGDAYCLRTAASIVGRTDLLDGMHIKPAGKASKTVVEAIVARAGMTEPVLVLLDNDDEGRKPAELLGGRFGFMDITRKFSEHKPTPSPAMVMTYAAVFPPKEHWFPYEAEDLFDPVVLDEFVERHGSAVIDGSKKRPDDRFHYDIGQAGKALLADHFDQHLRPAHVRMWLELIIGIRVALGLDDLGVDIDALIESADEPTPGGTTEGKRVLVVDGALDHARYQRLSAVVLNPDRVMPDDVTHVAFYSKGAIQPEVPGVIADHPGLLFSERTVQQLRATGDAGDARAAEVIAASLRADDAHVGTTQRVLVLSSPDDPRTTLLPGPVQNTKQRGEKKVAWMLGPRAVSYAALASGPATTDELDALDTEQGPGE